MVAFPSQVIRTIVVPNGATSGERVVIDGTTGTITVYGPDSTGPDSDIVAEIGNGVGLSVDQGGVDLQVLPNSGGDVDFPGLRWTEDLSQNFAFLNIVPVGLLGGVPVPAPGLNSGIGNLNDGSGNHTVRGRIFITPSSIDVSFVDSTNSSNFFGGNFQAGATFSSIGVHQSGGNPGTISFVEVEQGLIRVDVNDAGSDIIDATVDARSGFPKWSIEGETWHTLPLLNGWGVGGGSFQLPQYRAMPDNTVMIRGTLVATGATSTVIATLPAAYRPPASLQFSVGGSSPSPTASVTKWINVASSGNLSLSNGTLGSGSVALDGIRFSLDA